MKAIIRIFITGAYGKAGKCVARLTKPVWFKNGKLNQAATLRNGYTVLEWLVKPYGFGKQVESIAGIIPEAGEIIQ